jgi:hypothetical protein
MATANPRSFRYIEPGELVTLDADGRQTNIRGLTADTVRSFDGRDPEQVARMSRVMDLYEGRSPIDAREATARWLERFNIPPTDPRWQAEFDRLMEGGDLNRAVVAEARRIAEMGELITMTDGDLGTKCVYVNEGPDPCDECLPLGGLVMTLGEFEAEGLMPGDRCLGKDNCLCQLYPFDEV